MNMENGHNNMLSDEQRALVTRCLWSLQEADLSIEGLILTHVRGVAMTSTMHHNASTQRLTAVAVAMFLLGEHTSEAWGNGESLEVHVRVQLDPKKPDTMAMRYVSMRPVGPGAILLAVHSGDKLSINLEADLNTAAAYLEAILDNQPPPPLIWQSI